MQLLWAILAKYPYSNDTIHRFGVVMALSLRVNKDSPQSRGEWGAEVNPDTGMHGVTGLGHLDFLSNEQMLAAAAWLSPRQPRNGAPALGWMPVITQAPLGRRWHMPATLGDHRGIIKAAVTVVNRAANKGSRGKKEKRKQGREGSMGGG